MSAWTLMGEKAQVMTPVASVTPTSATTRLVNITASPSALARGQSAALSGQLHREQIEPSR